MIDYRALLEKYIRFISDEEGTDFIYRADGQFTEEEIAILRSLQGLPK